MSCRQCEAITQAPAPSLPIERGRPGPSLLAHVLVGTRTICPCTGRASSTIYGRAGVDLERSTLADWVGQAAFLRIVAPDGRELLPTPKPPPNGTLIKTLARAWR